MAWRLAPDCTKRRAWTNIRSRRREVRPRLGQAVWPGATQVVLKAGRCRSTKRLPSPDRLATPSKRRTSSPWLMRCRMESSSSLRTSSGNQDLTRKPDSLAIRSTRPVTGKRYRFLSSTVYGGFGSDSVGGSWTGSGGGSSVGVGGPSLESAGAYLDRAEWVARRSPRVSNHVPYAAQDYPVRSLSIFRSIVSAP